MTTFGDYHLLSMLLGLIILAGHVVLVSRRLSDVAWRGRSALETGLIGAGVAIYLCTMFATSFIEEEHEFWYFAATSLLLVLLIR